MEEGGYGTSHMPLSGAILCCTSIPPEERTALAAIGAQMGATIKLDLTSDVTHLIVGSINSAKYRYVAKSREDVKVLTPGWLEALRLEWMDGGDVDVDSLEQQYRLPTFYGLKICLTGFDNPDQRKYIQETAVQNGAEYHGDLTKNVTHLIAASPTGKKYEHALNWRMKVVTWEWFEQSVQRGMALEEGCYHPTMPVDERGKGAWDRKENISPTLGKRTRDAGQSQALDSRRSKLRRSASSKMGSQSEALWAGITAVGFERHKRDEDDWTDEELAKTSLPKPNAPVAAATKDVRAAPDDAQPEDPTQSHDGIFEGRMVFAYAFDLEKTSILQEHLASNGAVVIRTPTELANISADDLRRGYLVIPHDGKIDLKSLPAAAGAMCLATNWWVEHCLHAKCLVDPTEHVLYRPFDKLGINGFNNLIINSTAFSGIELLHVTKVIALMGATYDEYLTTKTSVLICNTEKPNIEKFQYATDKRIPAVHATWLWDCLRTGNLQAFDSYLLNTLPSQTEKSRQQPQQTFDEVPTAPLSREDSEKLRRKKAHASRPQSQNGPRRGGTLDFTLSTGPTHSSLSASSTHPNTTNDWSPDNDQGIEGYDGQAPLPLQDINPSVNSPRRPSTSSNTSNSRATTTSTRSNSLSEVPRKPAPAARTSHLPKDRAPDSGVPPLTDPAPEPRDYSSIMSNILAQRKSAAEQNPNSDVEKKKRRRQLGRAASSRSNPSTADDVVSRASSTIAAEHRVSDHDESVLDSMLDGARELGKGRLDEYQPSQELGWDAPGAQEAREQMIRAMGGKVEETGGVVKSVGVVRDVVSADSGIGRAGRRKRG